MGMIKKVNHKVVMLKNSNAWMPGCLRLHTLYRI